MFPFPHMIGSRPWRQYLGQALPEIEFPSCTVKTLIKEQKDVEHLKETAANQTRDKHITYGTEEKLTCPCMLGGNLSSADWTSDTSAVFNQEGQVIIGVWFSRAGA